MIKKWRHRLIWVFYPTIAKVPASIMGEMQVTASQEKDVSAARKNIEQSEVAIFYGSKVITLFLCGDVMTGRGIDQILPSPSDPVIYESYMRGADGSVKLGEKVNGFMPKRVDNAYVWGDALAVLAQIKPDLRIMTTSGCRRP